MTSNKSGADITSVSIDYKKHWNTEYIKKSTEKLGWFEKKSTQTIDLIDESRLGKAAKILNIGSGTSVLTDNLLELGFSNIITSDISEVSLSILKNRIGACDKVQFIVDDLLHSSKLMLLENIDLWVDRAVLHFFIEKDAILTYFNLLKKVLSPTGFVIIAVFAKDGADKCCKLPVKRYDITMLEKELGPAFKLIKTFNYVFINPYGGERPYIYALFQRKQ